MTIRFCCELWQRSWIHLGHACIFVISIKRKTCNCWSSETFFSMSSCVLQVWRLLQYSWSPRAWWRHQMETFSALLALGEGNQPVAGVLLSQRPVTMSFDVFLDLRLNRDAGDFGGHRVHCPISNLTKFQLSNHLIFCTECDNIVLCGKLYNNCEISCLQNTNAEITRSLSNAT